MSKSAAKHKKPKHKYTSPLVSIITICFNYSEHLEETIQSVLSQDYPDIEYIIIDGGSTDGSIDIIKRYEDRLAYWVSEPDRGISDAMNKGIQNCAGEIIGIIHAGDAYVKGAAAAAVSALTENPEYDFIFGDLEYIDEKGERLFTVISDKDYINKIPYTMPAVLHPTVFVKRETYELCGSFDISYKLAMDYEFFLRVTKTGRQGMYINKTLALMRFGGASYMGFYKSYKDVARASIHYGYNPMLAHLRLYVKGLMGLTRVGLEVLGLHGIVKILRKTIWGVKYE